MGYINQSYPSLTLFILWMMFSSQLNGQISDTVALRFDSIYLEGSLLLPDTVGAVPIVLIIAGSGPTDRDGNNPQMKNNSLRMLAEELAQHGIASLRYDKRGIGKSKSSQYEVDLRIEDYMEDATKWVNHLKDNPQYSSVTIVGHSEGSLIGMVASCDASADGFISLAGPGNRADSILKKQLSKQPEKLRDLSYALLDSLHNGHLIEDVPLILWALFRPSVQPYLISWFKYDPADILTNFKGPVLIVQGTKDIQVDEAEAKTLHQIRPDADLFILEKMNHVLKEVSSPQENGASYVRPDFPLHPELIHIIVQFITKKVTPR